MRIYVEILCCGRGYMYEESCENDYLCDSC